MCHHLIIMRYKVKTSFMVMNEACQKDEDLD